MGFENVEIEEKKQEKCLSPDKNKESTHERTAFGWRKDSFCSAKGALLYCERGLFVLQKDLFERLI